MLECYCAKCKLTRDAEVTRGAEVTMASSDERGPRYDLRVKEKCQCGSDRVVMRVTFPKELR